MDNPGFETELKERPATDKQCVQKVDNGRTDDKDYNVEYRNGIGSVVGLKQRHGNDDEGVHRLDEICNGGTKEKDFKVEYENGGCGLNGSVVGSEKELVQRERHVDNREKCPEKVDKECNQGGTKEKDFKDEYGSGVGGPNGSVAEKEPVSANVHSNVIVLEETGEKKHFFIIRWLCRYPCLMFWLALVGHVLFIAITAILYFTGYNILPLILEDMPIFNLHDLMYRRNLAWLQRDTSFPVFLFNAQYPSKRKRRSIHPNTTDPYPLVNPEDIHDVRLHLMYEVKENENVFTPRRLDAIKTFEANVVAPFKKGAKRASPAHYACGENSVLNIFNKNMSSLHGNFTNDTNSISRIFPYLGRDVVVDNTTGKVTTRYARSFVKLCWTYTYNNISVWSVDEVISEVEKQEKLVLNPKGITLFYWNYRSFSELAFRQATHDALYFIGSILFIFFFMWIQTSSFFITLFGTASILTSFAGGNLIYNCIIGYEYLGLFNIMLLFVVLGIGADDIFVFYDTWKSLDHLDNMEDRMALTFRRAGAAMFTTSLTTMAAFFVSSFSEILPISSFGTFAGLTVFVNYISVITFFPTVVAVHQRYIKNRCSSRKSASYSFDKQERHNRVFTSVSTFFKEKYYRGVTHRIGKWFIIVLFLILLAGMIYSCTIIKLDQRTFVKAFKDGNRMEAGLEKTAFGYKLGAEDKMVMVHLVWGIHARNMSACNRIKYAHWRPCPGVASYDEDFNIEKPENQLALLNVCRNLTNIHGTLRKELKLESSVNGTNSVVCFMEYFDQFLRAMSIFLNDNPALLNGRKVDLKVPLTREDIGPLVPTLGSFVGLKLNASQVKNPVQTVMAMFIEKNATQLKQFVGFKEVNNPIGTYHNGTPVYDQELLYAAVMIPLTEQEFRLEINEGLRLQDKWEEYTKETMKTMPLGVNKGWQIAGSWFIARQKQNMMFRALTGVALSVTLAFLVLLLTTRNFILAILAEVTLVGAVICVIGILPIARWDFGMLESINVCFVAGLSVDYIVHVVEAYSMSGCRTRQERTQDALGRIGVSVLSGAVTTLGASFFMFFSRILFFMQFGTFIFSTVGFSLLFALLFLPAVLDTMGPSEDIGSFKWLFNKMKKCCRRR